MPCLTKKQLRCLVDEVSSLVAKETGRGPVAARAEADDSQVTVNLHGVLSQMERLVVNQGRGDLVHEMRQVVAEAMADSWRELFQGLFEREVTEFSSNTDVEADARVLKFIIR